MERAGEVREDYCRYLMKKEKREDNISSSFFFCSPRSFIPHTPITFAFRVFRNVKATFLSHKSYSNFLLSRSILAYEIEIKFGD